MDPKSTVDTWSTDAYDLDGLLNTNEYQGVDATSPISATQLFPGDPKSGLPWDFHFQATGLGADATEACNADTDNGGVKDGHEVALGLDPLNPADDKTDRDGDGIPDYIEDDANPNGKFTPNATAKDGETNFADPDTDKDGLCDGPANKDGEFPGLDLKLTTKADNYNVLGYKVYAWDAVALAWKTTPLCMAGEDKNADGLFQPKGADTKAETLDDNETKANNWDTDSDGMRDYWEVMTRGEAMPPAPWTSTPVAGKYQCMNPNYSGDPWTVPDPADPTKTVPADPDGDGILTGWEHNGLNLTWDSASPNYQWVGDANNADDEYINPCAKDTDGGGAQDGWEWVDQSSPKDGKPDELWLNPTDPTDNLRDSDRDGLADVVEDSVNHNAKQDALETNWQNPDYRRRRPVRRPGVGPRRYLPDLMGPDPGLHRRRRHDLPGSAPPERCGRSHGVPVRRR